MASTNDFIFPESMADVMVNPFDIYFGSMLAKSTTPAACLIIESNAVTANQQIGTYVLTKTHPPTPSDQVSGMDRVEGMLYNTVKLYEHVKRPRRTPLSSSISLHEAQDPDRI
jgi:hypothetical protein